MKNTGISLKLWRNVKCFIEQKKLIIINQQVVDHRFLSRNPIQFSVATDSIHKSTRTQWTGKIPLRQIASPLPHSPSYFTGEGSVKRLPQSECMISCWTVGSCLQKYDTKRAWLARADANLSSLSPRLWYTFHFDPASLKSLKLQDVFTGVNWMDSQ